MFVLTPLFTWREELAKPYDDESYSDITIRVSAMDNPLVRGYLC